MKKLLSPGLLFLFSLFFLTFIVKKLSTFVMCLYCAGELLGEFMISMLNALYYWFKSPKKQKPLSIDNGFSFNAVYIIGA